MSVSPNPDTIIRIQRVGQEPDCSVCENKDSGQVCDPKHLTLKDATNASVEFTCPQPQEVFAVEINREIGTRKTDFSELSKAVTAALHHQNLPLSTSQTAGKPAVQGTSSRPSRRSSRTLIKPSPGI